ncbi:uroporphyrinogen-III synthase [Bacillus massiliglaciei]|uniref:uroporphyrinogen-III synthase n=1 Tax=Bacillus massiliglaciei TaxID=1816693 RepID=UPI000AE73E59|nr:uroporphyrinogen-III synthase [Bacillus massiliglaciei]
MAKLEGKKIAVLGPRKAEEISKIITNLGGIPLIRPAQGTVYPDQSQLENDIEDLIEGKYDWMILTTGIGTDILYQAAVKMGRGDEFLAALKKMKLAIRGYKTANMLKKLGLEPIARDDDGSTAGLIRALQKYSFTGKKAALQLHGDPAPLLIHMLDEQRVVHKEVLPYVHIPPEAEVMQQLTDELLAGEIDAAVFTSGPQGRNLLQFAREQGKEQEVIQAFEQKTAALSVGKVTAQSLHELGIDRVIYPEDQRMGSALVELVKFYEKKGSHSL